MEALPRTTLLPRQSSSRRKSKLDHFGQHDDLPVVPVDRERAARPFNLEIEQREIKTDQFKVRRMSTKLKKLLKSSSQGEDGKNAEGKNATAEEIRQRARERLERQTYAALKPPTDPLATAVAAYVDSPEAEKRVLPEPEERVLASSECSHIPRGRPPSVKARRVSARRFSMGTVMRVRAEETRKATDRNANQPPDNGLVDKPEVCPLMTFSPLAAALHDPRPRREDRRKSFLEANPAPETDQDIPPEVLTKLMEDVARRQRRQLRLEREKLEQEATPAGMAAILAEREQARIKAKSERRKQRLLEELRLQQLNLATRQLRKVEDETRQDVHSRAIRDTLRVGDVYYSPRSRAAKALEDQQARLLYRSNELANEWSSLGNAIRETDLQLERIGTCISVERCFL